MHLKYKIETKPCTWNKSKINAMVYYKRLFGSWSLLRTFNGDTETEAIDKAEDYIVEAKNRTETYGIKHEYTLWDAICDWWDNFKWHYLDFGFRENIHKYESKYFLPLKKQWAFAYPSFSIYTCSEITKSLPCSWFNKLMHKWFNKHVFYAPALVKSGLVPLARNNINWLFSYYSMALGWKDKFNTPRFEAHPQKSLWLFRVFGIGYFLVPDFEKYTDIKDHYGLHCDKYWEMLLWTTEYNDGDLDKARETWPWRSPKDEDCNKEDMWKDENMVSSWDERMVHPDYRKQ